MNNRHKLLYNKFVVFMGDSNIRSQYKDIVLSLQYERQLTFQERKAKGEKSFLNDTLLKKTDAYAGSKYEEIREYKTTHFHIKFYFITHAYDVNIIDYVYDLLDNIPNILILHSCLWDVTTYKDDTDIYLYNVNLLLQMIKAVLNKVLIIWIGRYPINNYVKGCLFKNSPKLDEDIINIFQTIDIKLPALVSKYSAFYVNTFKYLNSRNSWIEQDGIHWNGNAYRLITIYICNILEFTTSNNIVKKTLLPTPPIHRISSQDKSLHLY